MDRRTQAQGAPAAARPAGGAHEVFDLQARPSPACFVPGRAPAHPGTLLQKCFLAPLGLSQGAVARSLGISRRRLNEILRGRRAITADTALRLAATFQHDARFWIQLQAAWDLHQAWRKRARPDGRGAGAHAGMAACAGHALANTPAGLAGTLPH